jgi:hypothetical protein
VFESISSFEGLPNKYDKNIKSVTPILKRKLLAVALQCDVLSFGGMLNGS